MISIHAARRPSAAARVKSISERHQATCVIGAHGRTSLIRLGEDIRRARDRSGVSLLCTRTESVNLFHNRALTLQSSKTIRWPWRAPTEKTHVCMERYKSRPASC